MKLKNKLLPVLGSILIIITLIDYTISLRTNLGMDFKAIIEKMKQDIANPEPIIDEPQTPPVSAVLPTKFNKLESKLKEEPKVKEDFFSPFGSHPQDEFLGNVSYGESSYGTNLDHPVIDRGINKGMKAIGVFGMTPLTAKNIGKDLTNKQSLLYQALPPGHKDKEVQALGSMTPNQISAYLKDHPEVALRAARYMGTRLDKLEGDELDKAYRWNMGTSLKKSEIDPTKRDTSAYVLKYKEAKSRKK